MSGSIQENYPTFTSDRISNLAICGKVLWNQLNLNKSKTLSAIIWVFSFFPSSCNLNENQWLQNPTSTVCTLPSTEKEQRDTIITINGQKIEIPYNWRWEPMDNDSSMIID